MSRAVALFALLLAACTAHEDARVEPRREAVAPADTVVWTGVSTRAGLLAALRAAPQPRPVVIVFHAAWAMPSVELERRVFVEPAVAAELRRFTAIKVDVTEDTAAELQTLLGAETVPNIQMFAVDSGLAQALADGTSLPRPDRRVTSMIGPEELAPVLAAVR
jgi:thiol:disulfide interchange protein